MEEDEEHLQTTSNDKPLKKEVVSFKKKKAITAEALLKMVILKRFSFWMWYNQSNFKNWIKKKKSNLDEESDDDEDDDEDEDSDDGGEDMTFGNGNEDEEDNEEGEEDE